MYGCFLSQTDYQNAEYSSSDPMTISLTIRYDNAVQTPDKTGVGSIIGTEFIKSQKGVGAITG
jgi:hypothetical protein